MTDVWVLLAVVHTLCKTLWIRVRSLPKRRHDRVAAIEAEADAAIRFFREAKELPHDSAHFAEFSRRYARMVGGQR